MDQSLPSSEVTRVFENGEDGIACYRIPSIVRMITGELLALAEARVDNCGDHGGPIRLVAKIGDPTGTRWGKPITIAVNMLPDGEEQVAQNPCPVVDLMDPTLPGKILVMYNKAEEGERDVTARTSVRRVFLVESLDNGRSWVNERDITAEVHRANLPTYNRVHQDSDQRYNDPADWRANFPPVGHAIQLQGGAHGTLPTRGRLLFSSYITRGDAGILQGQAHLIYSDDHGATWFNGDPSPVMGVNEMMSVELANGDVLVNFRSYVDTDEFSPTKFRGQLVFHLLPDGTFDIPSTWEAHPELPMPRSGLQGSIHRLNNTPEGPIYYTGCDSSDHRVGLTLWRSDDDGSTWQMCRRIDPGPSAYSDMVTLVDGRLGILYETGGEHGIVFTRF